MAEAANREIRMADGLVCRSQALERLCWHDPSKLNPPTRTVGHARNLSRELCMADVVNNSTPPTVVETRSGGSGAVWAVVVVVLLLVIGWFVFGGGLNSTKTTKIDINTPGASSGNSGGGTGGGTSGG